MRWYQTNLRFKADPFPESSPHAFCILSKDDVEIMLQQLAGYKNRTFSKNARAEYGMSI